MASRSVAGVSICGRGPEHKRRVRPRSRFEDDLALERGPAEKRPEPDDTHVASGHVVIISRVFREVTPRNWAERDPLNAIFAMPGKLGMRQMTGDDWAGLFLGVELSARVPEPVQHLFLVARNTLPYGHFFYPLYTLGSEQLYRVADAAALHRYRDLGGPKTKRGRDPTFMARIHWLYEHGGISEAHTDRWTGFRELRNHASHAEMQSLFTPGNAYTMLRAVVECVNALYAPPTLGRAIP